jgi:predicted AlkP superfamily phosphohydrolase/phosphomutase
MDKKVFVIGLDGATPQLLFSWAREGKLPALKKIIGEGTSGILKSTPIPITSSAWVSAFTGKNPGKHGIFDFIKRNNGNYGGRPVCGGNREGKAVWNILSENGKKVIIVNVPMTYPPEKVNGIMISGMDAPSIKNEFTYPPELYSELKKEIGEYRIHHKESFAEEEAGDYIKDVEKVTELQKKACIHLLKNYEWDFFAAVFMALDPIQHFFWRHMDSTHPLYHEERAKKWGNVILKQYQSMDRLVDELLRYLDKETTVFILSDHGHGPYYKTVYFNVWLMENGFLKLKRNLPTKIKYFAFKNGITVKNAYQILSKIGLTNIIAKSSRETRTKLVDSLLSYNDIDWDKTKAYSFGNYSQIYLNMENKKNGMRIKNDDYTNIRSSIIEMLYNLKDPETNEKIVDDVIKKEDVFSGPHLGDAPDIIVRMKDSKYVGYAVGGKTGAFGNNSVFGSPVIGSSAHSINGVLMVVGDNIKNGAKIEAKITDVTPTILKIVDIFKSDLDGHVLDVFKLE